MKHAQWRKSKHAFVAGISALGLAAATGCSETDKSSKPSSKPDPAPAKAPSSAVARAGQCLSEVGFDVQRQDAKTTNVLDPAGNYVAAIQSFETAKRARAFAKDDPSEVPPDVYGRHVFEYRTGIESDSEFRVIHDCGRKLRG